MKILSMPRGGGQPTNLANLPQSLVLDNNGWFISQNANVDTHSETFNPLVLNVTGHLSVGADNTASIIVDLTDFSTLAYDVDILGHSIIDIDGTALEQFGWNNTEQHYSRTYNVSSYTGNHTINIHCEAYVSQQTGKVTVNGLSLG